MTIGEMSHFLRFLTVLFIAALGLNWPWEMIQMPAYAAMARRSWRESALPCTLASLGDAVITLGIYGVGALAAGRLRWGLSRRWNVYAAVALLGLIWAVAVEGAALASGRWSYTERMPIVPGLGIGLWPLLQLALLTPAALGITGWWSRAKSQAH